MDSKAVATLIVLLVVSGLIFISLTAIFGLGVSYASVMAGMIGGIVTKLIALRKNP